MRARGPSRRTRPTRTREAGVRGGDERVSASRDSWTNCAAAEGGACRRAPEVDRGAGSPRPAPKPSPGSRRGSRLFGERSSRRTRNVSSAVTMSRRRRSGAPRTASTARERARSPRRRARGERPAWRRSSVRTAARGVGGPAWRTSLPTRVPVRHYEEGSPPRQCARSRVRAPESAGRGGSRPAPRRRAPPRAGRIPYGRSPVESASSTSFGHSPAITATLTKLPRGAGVGC